MFSLCFLAVGFASGNKIPEKDSVIDNLDNECKECTIVSYADGAEDNYTNY